MILNPFQVCATHRVNHCIECGFLCENPCRKIPLDNDNPQLREKINVACKLMKNAEISALKKKKTK